MAERCVYKVSITPYYLRCEALAKQHYPNPRTAVGWIAHHALASRAEDQSGKNWVGLSGRTSRPRRNLLTGIAGCKPRKSSRTSVRSNAAGKLVSYLCTVALYGLAQIA